MGPSLHPLVNLIRGGYSPVPPKPARPVLLPSYSNDLAALYIVPVLAEPNATC
jgi:hypothetical protein